MMYAIRNKVTGEFHKRGYAGFEWVKHPHQGWGTANYIRAADELESIGFDQAELVRFEIATVFPEEQVKWDIEECREAMIQKLLEEYSPLEEEATRDIDSMPEKRYKRWKELRAKLRERDALPA